MRMNPDTHIGLLSGALCATLLVLGWQDLLRGDDELAIAAVVLATYFAASCGIFLGRALGKAIMDHYDKKYGAS